MDEERVAGEETLLEWMSRLQRERRQQQRFVAAANIEREQIRVRKVAEANRISHAQTRARQTSEERSSVRDANRVRHAVRRAGMTPNERNIERDVNRRQHAQSYIPHSARKRHACGSENLPEARRTFDGTNNQMRHMLGQMEIRCDRCEALHWIEERAIASSLSNPKFSTCCSSGKVHLPPIAQPPETLRRLLEGPAPEAKRFRDQIRKYNNAFAFTSVGANIEQSMTHGGIYTYCLHGELHHRIGSLLPTVGQAPKFSQIYINDPQMQMDFRLAFTNELDEGIIESLQQMLRECNPYVQLYESARERLRAEPHAELCLKLVMVREKDARRYNMPTTNEIGAIMVGDGMNEEATTRDIIIKRQGGPLQRISPLHPSYLPMHYTLLYPYGQDGWHPNIPLRGFSCHRDRDSFVEDSDGADETIPGRGGSKRVTMNQYFAFHLHIRHNEHLFLAGRLLQQFIVDGYAATEDNRLNYVRLNQENLRADIYRGAQDAFHSGDVDAAQIGQKLILPSSFTGGPRQMVQLYQDAMAIVRKFGKPDVFLTFTCNPKWEEIVRELLPGQTSNDRPDLVSRVYHLKLKELLRDLEMGVLGTPVAKVWVVEFQKRGLPHAHILLILEGPSKFRTPEEIDSLVSAEIPNPDTHPLAYATVIRCMVHGPCNVANPMAPCMKNGKCTKRYPRKFNDETKVDDDGYPMYRRRNNECGLRNAGGNWVDNRWIVPHNLWLATKYDAHINVEVCSSIQAVKYLFKYVYKGHDCATAVINGPIDEVRQFINARYVSPPEAIWRQFEFKLHAGSPTITRLQIHLPNEQRIIFRADAQLAEIVERAANYKTTLTEFFLMNHSSELARQTLYQDFPSMFTWNNSRKEWKLRKKGTAVGRMYFVGPSGGERYFERTLLTVVKGPTSFEGLRTFAGRVYDTFKEACVARGLYETDEEWAQCLEEAACMQTGSQLRSLFVTILTHGPPANPLQLWHQFRANLTDDCTHQLRQKDILEPTEDQIISFGLILINNELACTMDKQLTDFGLPDPPMAIDELEKQNNRLLQDQLDNNIPELRFQLAQTVPNLNSDQRRAFDDIIGAYEAGSHGTFFIDGPGGTGKTYLENIILRRIRSDGNVALAVASSGIAALLLDKGWTAHSRFKIPLQLTSASQCAITRQMHLADLLRHTKLILWDEAPMCNKLAFEAVDQTLRDILGNNSPFGGIIFVMSGDFRQVLPVIPKATRAQIVMASVKESRLWKHVKTYRLTINMRTANVGNRPSAELNGLSFSEWLLALGEHRLPTVDGEYVQCPGSMIVRSEGNSRDTLISHVYPNVRNNNQTDAALEFFTDRAILAAHNKEVDDINNDILNLLPGNEHVCFSADSISDPEGANLIPVEYLNRLEPNGWPPHRLTLKNGAPIMLLRNLDRVHGLCNGTRLIVRQFSHRIIDAEVMTGSHKGHRAFIPRIGLTSTEVGIPYTVKRKQFPVRLAFAMTINKSQGQTLQHVGIHLEREVFSHGQLYVAFSRAVFPCNIHVLLPDDEHGRDGRMRNVVYSEALNH